MQSFHGRWHWRVSHNLQVVWVKQRRSTMVFNPGTSRDGVRVWPSRWKRSRGSTNVSSHIPWQEAPISHSIWSHLSTFVWTRIPWRTLRTSVVTWMGFRSGTVCQALCLMLFCSAIYRGNYAFPDRRWYELLCTISSQESPPEVCRWT